MYVSDNIICYYRDKAQKNENNGELVLRKADEQGTLFRLYRITDGTELARGDEQTMKCLYKKLKSLEITLVGELEALINDANTIVTLFNCEYKTKVKDMMADIDDNYLSGECIFEERLRKQVDRNQFLSQHILL